MPVANNSVTRYNSCISNQQLHFHHHFTLDLQKSINHVFMCVCYYIIHNVHFCTLFYGMHMCYCFYNSKAYCRKIDTLIDFSFCSRHFHSFPITQTCKTIVSSTCQARTSPQLKQYLGQNMTHDFKCFSKQFYGEATQVICKISYKNTST